VPEAFHKCDLRFGCVGGGEQDHGECDGSPQWGPQHYVKTKVEAKAVIGKGLEESSFDLSYMQESSYHGVSHLIW